MCVISRDIAIGRLMQGAVIQTAHFVFFPLRHLHCFFSKCYFSLGHFRTHLCILHGGLICIAVCLSVCPDNRGVVGFLVRSSNHLLLAAQAITMWFSVLYDNSCSVLYDAMQLLWIHWILVNAWNNYMKLSRSTEKYRIVVTLTHFEVGLIAYVKLKGNGKDRTFKEYVALSICICPWVNQS